MKDGNKCRSALSKKMIRKNETQNYSRSGKVLNCSK